MSVASAESMAPPVPATTKPTPKRRKFLRRDDGTTVILPVKVLIFLAVVLFPMASIAAMFKFFGPAR